MVLNGDSSSSVVHSCSLSSLPVAEEGAWLQQQQQQQSRKALPSGRQEEQQRRSHRGPTEEQQLGQKMEDGHGVFRNTGRHVRGHYVAMFSGTTRSVHDRQRHHGAVHLALQTDLLLVAAHAGLRRRRILRASPRAADGEEGGEAEVAAEAPPKPGALVGQTQNVEHSGSEVDILMMQRSTGGSSGFPVSSVTSCRMRSSGRANSRAPIQMTLV
ncbi:hypothetical protein KUCAC02_006322 [Chaenocephalus aceratus]|uniref:Uncharacterized protein n=1 Tax=Chaenocephalus aceratus TaxID=36190 RepID=A0ACB9VRK4_CHAAC|nr:hypothetical protein KUCAC02_006322 [Chaenocephalus aceratus]